MQNHILGHISVSTWQNKTLLQMYLSCLIDVMHKLSRELDRRTQETIYKTFIRSKLEYACLVWDDYSEQDSEAIENCVFVFCPKWDMLWFRAKEITDRPESP